MKRIISKFKYIIFAVTTMLLFWLFCCSYTDSHQVSITRNIFSGQMNLKSSPGFSVSWPWVQVVRLDIRPIRICIESRSRSFECRLVQFQTEKWQELISVEGFRYYWFDNRFSLNWHNESYKGFRDLIHGHGYDDSCKFIKVISKIDD